MSPRLSPRARAQALAIAGALAVFLLLMLALRLRAWLPFLGAALAYLGLLWALRPRRPAPLPEAALPDGLSREEHRAATGALEAARRNLAALAGTAPPADRGLVERMAALVGAIRRHHEASPGHVLRTRGFVRHTLPRMVEAVAGYVDLARRAPRRDDRLAAVASRLEGFVPVLENIDRACIEDDLMALEINVEVLDEQLRPGGSLGDGTEGRGT